LHEQYSKGVEYITKYELNKLGFDTGFFSNLTARGGKYGKYELTKAPSEKVFVLRLNPNYKGNAKKNSK
jgi:hypothetical protein